MIILASKAHLRHTYSHTVIIAVICVCIDNKRKRLMRKLLFLTSILALFLMTAFPAVAQNDDAMLRVGHFSPDAPAVDIYVNGELAIEALAFPEVTTFIDLPADDYDISVTATGTSINDAVIGPATVSLEAGSAVTVGAVGSVEDDSLNATVIVEDYSPIDAGKARITVVHTIENEATLDIYGSSVPLISDLSYPNSVEGNDGAFTRDVPAGRYNFEANIADTDDTLRVANGVQIEDGEYYLIVALGPQSQFGELLIVTPDGYFLTDDITGDPQVEMVTEEPEPTDVATPDSSSNQLAMIRVGHFSPDAPAVDVYVDGALTVESLEFPEVTPFLELPAGDYEIAVAPADTSIDEAVIGPTTLTLTGGSAVTVGAVGSVEQETITATVILEDYNPIDAGNARITVVHTIENEGSIDIYGSGLLLIQALRYPNPLAGGDGAFTRDIPAGRYSFDATFAETDLVLRSTDGVEVEDGQYYLIVALGPQAPDGDLLIVTPDGHENPEEE